MKRRRPPSTQKRNATAVPKRMVISASAVSRKRVKAVVDPVTGMNITETKYAKRLEEMRLLGEIIEWKFEPIKLRLADSTFYTPDFAVQLPDHTLELHDVKGRSGAGPGGWEEDARVKIKVAAKLYPWFRFVGACKSGLGWKREDF